MQLLLVGGAFREVGGVAVGESAAAAAFGGMRCRVSRHK